MKFDIAAVMSLAPVIPVLVVDDLAKAVPLAEALVAGGLRALEVTMRTPQALEAMREMAQIPGAVVGAGTVLNGKDLDTALAAGARFVVSPGLTEPLGRAAIESGVPFLPGTANAGDVMRGLDMGLAHFKFFPAMAAGGPRALKALVAPLAAARFCPTGGIGPDNAGEWLAMPQVLCVGGSWMVREGAADGAAVKAAAMLARGG